MKKITEVTRRMFLVGASVGIAVAALTTKKVLAWSHGASGTGNYLFDTNGNQLFDANGNALLD
jgi:hypothetical protein